MIKYNEVTFKNNYLSIDYEIEDLPYYNGTTGTIRVRGVRIDTSLTYGTSTPYSIDEEDGLTYKKKLYFPELKDELIIITPIMDLQGLPANAPCGADVIDKYVLYDRELFLELGLKCLKELSQDCAIPKRFIDFYLRSKALEMAISTCNYTEAVKYWKMHNKASIRNTTSNCGCNGLN